MGYKSRGNFGSKACFKSDCANRDILCDDCYNIQGRMTEYIQQSMRKITLEEVSRRKNLLK